MPPDTSSQLLDSVGLRAGYLAPISQETKAAGCLPFFRSSMNSQRGQQGPREAEAKIKSELWSPVTQEEPSRY